MKLEELNKEIDNCARCGLAETRNNVLCGEGNPDARLMLIAQAPGVEENKEGEMFIGPSGEVLDELLDNAGVNYEEIYLTNLIKCMLPDYRKPREEEIQSCSRWLDQEIEIVDPAILVPLGWYSTRYLFNKYGLEIPADKAEVFATLHWIESDEIKIFPLSHPCISPL